jgi:hypothetical protein
MLLLTKPTTQDRLNAAVFEIIGLNVMGSIGIPGDWDANSTAQYIERRLKRPITQHFCREHGVRLHTGNKCIYFTQSGVLIQPMHTLMP